MALSILPDVSDPPFNRFDSIQYLQGHQVHLLSNASVVSAIDRSYADELMIKLAKSFCQRYSIVFLKLTNIQRKFVTHYRCNNCGLLPLHCINLSHIKRVRCGKCGELIAFKGTGKYGRLRKEIALELREMGWYAR